MKEDECCPKFEPKKWDNKVLNWKGKKFVRGRVFTLFYIPLNFGGVITKIMKKIDSAKGKCVDWLTLSDHTSKWNMDLYIAVDKKIEGMENVAISGKFLSKVYEGPFRDAWKWCKDFEVYAKKKGHKIKKQYRWYTTCPRCAKKYGKNYVVVIGEIRY